MPKQSQKLRWGLLSTARINRRLIQPIRNAARSELVAVASRSADRAQAYADEWDIPRAYGSYEALLDAPDVDVVYNPLPNTLHAAWTVRAAEAGKHVLCEKPIVVTLRGLEQIEAAVAAHDVVVFEAFMYLHHPQTRKVLEMVRGGELGQVQLITSWFSFYLPPEDADNIRLSPDLGGGALWDVGVYPNSLAIAMAGERPAEVWAQHTVGASGVDVRMVGQLRFANGIVAQVASGFRMPHRRIAHIVGDAGSLTLPDPWQPGVDGEPGRILFTPRGEAERTLTTPVADPYQCEVEAMEACVLDGADPVVPLSLSRDFLRSALAQHASARSGQPVTLD